MTMKKESSKSKKKTKEIKGRKKVVKEKNEERDESEEESGASLDDAFAGDDDVEYGKSKPFKAKKKSHEGMDDDEIEGEIDGIEEEMGGKKGDKEVGGEVTVKASKPISQVKKGDKIRIDGVEYEVDDHYVLMDHGTTKEMAIEIFNPKTDKDYQIRYFNDQAESTIELYELQEIMYFKKPMIKIEW